jgi:hypothetical protein
MKEEDGKGEEQDDSDFSSDIHILSHIAREFKYRKNE